MADTTIPKPLAGVSSESDKLILSFDERSLDALKRLQPGASGEQPAAADPLEALITRLDAWDLVRSCKQLNDTQTIEVYPVAGASLNVIRQNVVRLLIRLGFDVAPVA